jgi:hypothetical protein
MFSDEQLELWLHWFEIWRAGGDVSISVQEKATNFRSRMVVTAEVPAVPEKLGKDVRFVDVAKHGEELIAWASELLLLNQTYLVCQPRRTNSAAYV